MNPRKILTASALALAALVGLAGPASACHPVLEVSADCRTITARATPWVSDDTSQRVNPDVQVLVDGQVVTRGLLTPDTPLVATVPATPGKHAVEVVAVAAWGPAGEWGDAGSSSSATIEVPTCPVPTTTTTEVVSAEIVPPTTTQAPPEVANTTVERPTVLAFTGSPITKRALVAGGLMVIGLLLIGLPPILAARRD